MKIMKFGGSSVGSSELIKKVISIIKDSIENSKGIVVVFSAFKGVTDQLIALGRFASQGDESYYSSFKELESRHFGVAKDIISTSNQSKVFPHLIRTLNELQDVLHGVYLVKEASPRTLDFIMSFGERLSAYLISEAMLDRKINCEFLDSREVIKTNDHFGSAKVDFSMTNQLIVEYFQHHKLPQIITGFIGSTQNNETTTLGRGGSDYSASIFGAVCNAEVIEIWTDVNGVMTADPRKVEKAFTISNLSYEEAMELSHFGAAVVHPATMQPALDKKIPIKIKNTFNPQDEGTTISKKSLAANGPIKGISSIDDIALIRVQGSGMVGVAGVAKRIFGAMANNSINVIFITQASSEHSVCFAILPQQAQMAKKALEAEFQLELRDKMISEIVVEKDLSIIAIVGERMRHTPGISGKAFYALGRNGINVNAIAQGSSELNISVVVSKEDEAKTLNALHDAFFLSSKKTINLFLVGTGLIGKTLLKQIHTQSNTLAQEYTLLFDLVGLSNIENMLFDRKGISLSNWRSNLQASNTKANLAEFFNTMTSLNLQNSIFIDCTASDEVVKMYNKILDANISIVTPNKKAISGQYQQYLEIKKAARKHNVQFAYETNVGASLPIIGTIRDIIVSGDKIVKMEGVLSGTLSYIFNSFCQGKTFSTVVKEAKEKGYTEPDPREDLKGSDVARKLLILCREIGLTFEREDIYIENILPESAIKAKSIESFFKELKKLDKEFEKKRKHAAEKNCVLRYIAQLENNKAEILLKEVDENHPFYKLSKNDNILALYTVYCQDRPIVIKGPGAGVEVTAAGVLADIIRVATFLS
jgi:aspartokinase/homoserine dehydrogenase 1